MAEQSGRDPLTESGRLAELLERAIAREMEARDEAPAGMEYGFTEGRIDAWRSVLSHLAGGSQLLRDAMRRPAYDPPLDCTPDRGEAAEDLAAERFPEPPDGRV